MVLNFWSVPKYNNYQKPKIIPCYTNHMSNKLLKLFNVWSNDIFFFQFFQTCMHLLILALWVQTFFFLRYFRNVSLYHFVRIFLYFYHFLNRHFGTWKVIPRVTLRFWVKNGRKRYPHRAHHGLNKKTGPSRRRRGNSPFRATTSTHPLYHDITFLRQ